MKVNKIVKQATIFLAGMMATSMIAVDELRSQCEIFLASASDAQNDDYLGSAVSVDAAIAAIGTPSSGSLEGAVYVYRNVAGLWGEAAKLVASDAAADDQFGSSIDVQGDVIVVGAQSNTNAGFSTGSAYIFRFNGMSWIEEQKIIASDAMPGARFGASLAVDGARIVVGAPGDDQAGISAGAAYVFSFDGIGWNQEAKYVASDAASFDALGSAVDLQGDRAVVGAPGKNRFNGGAYVIDRNGASWSETSILVPTMAGSIGFATSLSLDGSRFAVGAPLDDSGFVFLYESSGGVFVETLFIASDAADADFYGGSVSLSEDHFVVGASGGDDSGTMSGVTYFYEFDGTSWIEDKLVPSGYSSTDRFGYAVAIRGNTVAASSPWDDPSGVRNAGAASIFDLASTRARTTEYGVGWPGTGGIPSITVEPAPALGTTVGVSIENSVFPSSTLGSLLIGSSAASQDTPLEGTLLVDPSYLYPLSFPANTTDLVLVFDIPTDLALVGSRLYMQALEADPGASRGVSFTAGLEVVIGLCSE